MRQSITFRLSAFVLAGALLGFPATTAAVSTQAVTFNSAGNTNSLEFITGWEFSIANPIVVSHLGHVDMQNNGIANGADVGIWSVSTGTLLDSVTVLPSSPPEASGVGSTLYEPITPLTLSAGNYIVAAQRNGENFYYDTPHTTASSITWVAGKAAGIGPLPISTAAFAITRDDIGSYFGANLKFEDTGGGPISLSRPTGRAVFQRGDRNRTDVSVEGTYTGSVTRIEARAVPRDGYAGVDTGWRVIDVAPSGGKFSSSLTVGTGWYDLEVRTFDGATEVGSAAVERIGVGEVFVAAGQSNSANYGSPRQTPADDRVSAATGVAATVWRHANDPQPIATGTGGSPWPELGDLVATEYDVPVGFVSVGVGATQVSQWLPGTNHYDSRLKATVQALGADGFRAVLWHQGESDSLAATTASTYASRLQAIIGQSRVDAGFDVPWGVALASYHPDSWAEHEAQVIAGQQKVIADDPLVFEGAFTDDFHSNGWLADTVHFNQTGLDTHAARWLQQIQSADIIVPEPPSLTLAVLSVIALLGWGRWTRSRRPAKLP